MMVLCRTVKFSGSLPSWDGSRQEEQVSPSGGARKGDGIKKGGANYMGRDVGHGMCPQLVPSGVHYG